MKLNERFVDIKIFLKFLGKSINKFSIFVKGAGQSTFLDLKIKNVGKSRKSIWWMP